MKEKINAFFMVWGIILVVNQLFIFHGCFSPSCLLAALPHTGIIAFFLVRAGNKNNEQPADKPDLSRTEKPPISDNKTTFKSLKDLIDESNKEVDNLFKNIPETKVVTETENKPAEPDFFKQKGDKYEKLARRKDSFKSGNGRLYRLVQLESKKYFIVYRQRISLF